MADTKRLSAPGPSTKNFVGGGDEQPTDSKAFVDEGLLSPVEHPPVLQDPAPDIPIEELPTAYRFTIPKSYLEQANSHELGQLVSLATSPLFIPLPSERQYLTYGPGKAPRSCGIFMEQMPHYTGGRYSMFLLGVILSQVLDVTIITNTPAPFEKDFLGYNLSRFRRIVDTRWGMNISENSFDFVIGVPNVGGQFAKAYSERFGIPCYLVLFESPNFKGATYPSGQDATEEYWKNYKKCLLTCDGIVSPSAVSSQWAQEWLPDFEGPWFVLEPPINQLVADAALAGIADPVFDDTAETDDELARSEARERKAEPEYGTELVFCARMVDFKNPIGVFDALAKRLKEPAHVTVMGRVGPNEQARIDTKKPEWEKNGLIVDVMGMVDDRAKFEAIKRADVMLFPSLFEGFGMPPEEALYMHTPCVAYDLPVLRRSYGDGLFYAPLGDEKAFANLVAQVLDPENAGWVSERVAQGRSRILAWCTLKTSTKKALDIFRVGGYGPKLSVGMIVFNGDTYLTEALDGVYDIAHEIIIVEGAVEGMWQHADERGSSTDATLQKIAAYPDPDGKIVLVPPPRDHRWNDKIEMQNEIASRVTGDIYLKMDSDEIWNPQDVVRLMKEFEKDRELAVIRVGFHHFWTNFTTVAVGCPQWESIIPRMWRWRSGFHHEKSFNCFVDSDGHPVREENNYKTLQITDKLVHHFGYVLPVSKVRAKLGYYAGRGIETNVEDRYTNWQQGQETQPTTGGGTAEPFGTTTDLKVEADRWYDLKVEKTENPHCFTGRLSLHRLLFCIRRSRFMIKGPISRKSGLQFHIPIISAQYRFQLDRVRQKKPDS